MNIHFMICSELACNFVTHGLSMGAEFGFLILTWGIWEYVVHYSE